MSTATLASPSDNEDQHLVSIEAVREAVIKLGEKDDVTIRVLMATFLSTYMEPRDPLWILLAGPAGSNKTTLVDLFRGHEDVYRVDALTPNPFTSGHGDKNKQHDLLEKLDHKCFMVKEYCSILERREDTVKSVLSDLTAIYDGEYSKHSSARGTITYTAYFTHIGCVTEKVLKKRQHYMSILGQRFLIFRKQPRPHGEDYHAMTIIDDPTLAKDVALKIVQDFIKQHKPVAEQWRQIQVPPASKSYIAKAANFVALGRATFDADGTDPDREHPFRVNKQLEKMSIALTIVDGERIVALKELKVISEVAISTLPINRSKVIRAFAQGRCLTVRELASEIDFQEKTVKRTLDELVRLKLLVFKDIGGTYQYSIAEDFKEILSPNLLQQKSFEEPTIPF